MPSNDDANWEICGREIRVTSLDKLYWPDDKLTKGNLLDYYRTIAGTILPYLRHRPITLRAYPNGIKGPGFWRREKTENSPEWLPSVSYQPESREGRIEVPVIDDEAALVWYADHSAIEFHMWMSLRDELDRPDWAVFDLDRGEEVEFSQVLQASLHVRDELERNNLQSFAKTSGGTGLHIFVPIRPTHTYDDVREWVHATAQRLEERYPGKIAAASGGTHRGDLVTIDHAQNSIARNTATPYTVRARPSAPVSTPVTWTEVESGKIRPEQFTLRTVPTRLETGGDRWAGASELRQELNLNV